MSLELIDWGWRYASRRAWAVRHLDLTIEDGQRVLLLGASGSGKSTVLHGLANLLGGADEGEYEGTFRCAGRMVSTGPSTAPPDAAPSSSGAVTVPEASSSAETTSSPSTATTPTALVMQDPESQIVLSRVGDDVAFGAENLGLPRDEIWRRVKASLKAVNLGLPLDHSTAELSGGQKQRLVIAGALAMGARWLLLDEPTANLDPAGVTEVRDAVAAAAADRETGFIIVEHHCEVWAPLVDRVIVLSPGGIVADGRPDDIFGSMGEALADMVIILINSNRISLG